MSNRHERRRAEALARQNRPTEISRVFTEYRQEAETLIQLREKHVDQMMGLNTLEIFVIKEMIWIKAHATDLRGEALTFALSGFRDRLIQAWDKLKAAAEQVGEDVYQLSPGRGQLYDMFISGLDAALSSTGDDGAALRKIPLDDQDIAPGITQAVDRQRLAAEQPKGGVTDYAKLTRRMDAQIKRRITELRQDPRFKKQSDAAKRYLFELENDPAQVDLLRRLQNPPGSDLSKYISRIMHDNTLDDIE